MKGDRDGSYINQRKVVQQETAYSAVVVKVSPSLPISTFHVYMTPFRPLLGQKQYRDGDTYDHSLQLHYRQFLVALLFADLPSLSPFINFYQARQGTCALAQTAPLLSRRLVTRAMASFRREC